MESLLIYRINELNCKVLDMFLMGMKMLTNMAHLQYRLI